MPRYKLKPDNVEAVKFDGKNWFAVKQLLGPHLTQEGQVWENQQTEYRVFDISGKEWLVVEPDQYVVRDNDGAVRIVPPFVFEKEYEEDIPSINMFPNPMPGIYGGGRTNY